MKTATSLPDEFAVHDTGDDGKMTLDEYMRQSINLIVDIAQEAITKDMVKPGEVKVAPIIFDAIRERLFAEWLAAKRDYFQFREEDNG